MGGSAEGGERASRCLRQFPPTTASAVSRRTARRIATLISTRCRPICTTAISAFSVFPMGALPTSSSSTSGRMKTNRIATSLCLRLPTRTSSPTLPRTDFLRVSGACGSKRSNGDRYLALHESMKHLIKRQSTLTRERYSFNRWRAHFGRILINAITHPMIHVLIQKRLRSGSPKKRGTSI